LGADGGLIKPDRFGETGKGSIEHSDPDDLNQPFVLTSTLALDPIAVQFAGVDDPRSCEPGSKFVRAECGAK
jgi:hypothetical protein